jgi:hypothetical protein
MIPTVDDPLAARDLARIEGWQEIKLALIFVTLIKEGLK